MGPEEKQGGGKKALALLGSAVFVVVTAGVALYTFLSSMEMTLHPDPAGGPSVGHAAPLPQAPPRS